jgi:hypothetical protein
MSSSSTTSTTLNYVHYVATSTSSLSLKINSMSPLFMSYSEVDCMMKCMMFYHACLDLSANCKYLVCMSLWLYACWSYDSSLGLVKLILYYVNFVTI